MNGIFSLESKLMQMLGYLADLLILNLVFLVCCLPVVTIGPAQAGLYTAMRVLQDPEDDSSCLKAFFRGFANGFLTITAASLVLSVLELILAYTLMMSMSYSDLGLFIHWIFPLVILIIVLIYHSFFPLFHSRFSCTFSQLFYNVWVMMISHPLQAILAGVLTWLPLVLFLLAPTFFVYCSIIFLALYYSVCFLLVVLMMKKPFNKLIDHHLGLDNESAESSTVAE